jgi:hypothetical protein
MEQIIGGFKEYIVIEREVLNELIKEGELMEKESKGLYAKGIGTGMIKTVEKIKENNIYNKDFKIKS